MYFYKLHVHSTIDVTKVEDSCELNEVFAHCSLSFFSARCLLLTLESIRIYLYKLKVHCTIDIT